PMNPDEDDMRAAKFLKSFDNVRGMIALDVDSEIRVEYGDRIFFPSTYHVRSVTSDGATTRVSLEPPRATCKARDRRMAAAESSSANDSCCLAAQACC